MVFHQHVVYLARLLLLFIGLLQVEICAEYEFIVRVGPRDRSCYFQTVDDPVYVAMEIEYQVVDGGDLDISYMLTNPRSVVLASDYRQSEGTKRIDVTQIKGDYEICFDNTFSYHAEKQIVFNIYLEDAMGNTDDVKYDKFAIINENDANENIERSKNVVNKLKNNMNRMEHFQSLIRAHESRDRSIMEANFERVNFWSMVHLFTMLFAAALQVYLVRCLFEDNSKLGRLMRQ